MRRRRGDVSSWDFNKRVGHWDTGWVPNCHAVEVTLKKSTCEGGHQVGHGTPEICAGNANRRSDTIKASKRNDAKITPDKKQDYRAQPMMGRA